MTTTGPAAAKRFFENADAAPVEGGYAIELDGKPVRTPMGEALVLPGRPLADAVVAEWQAQKDTIDPFSMPLCGYANTAIDRVGMDRQTIFDNLLHFAATDLLCYRADQPEELVVRQRENWQPLVDWAASALGAKLQVTVGILPIEQSDEAISALSAKLSELDAMELTAVASLAAACGSLVLALAVSEEHINAEQAYDLSQMDDIFQIERWGPDSEAVDRQTKLRQDIASATQFLTLLRS